MDCQFLISCPKVSYPSCVDSREVGTLGFLPVATKLILARFNRPKSSVCNSKHEVFVYTLPRANHNLAVLVWSSRAVCPFSGRGFVPFQSLDLSANENR